MDKPSLRRRLRLVISNIKDREEQSEKIANLALKAISPYGSICIYNSLPSEADTKALIEYYRSKCDVYLPVVEGEDMLLVKVGKDSKFSIGAFGISEPIGERLLPKSVNPDVTVTPLLGVDKKLNRLGKGKGYYDRYFASVDTLKVGLAFNEQVLERIDTDEWDCPLDVLITPKGIIRRSDICE